MSPLPVCGRPTEHAACGSQSCANTACPFRRAAEETTAAVVAVHRRGVDRLDDLLRRLAVEPAGPEDLTDRILDRLRREGLLDRGQPR